MDLIVPFAAALADAGRDAQRRLALPRLQALLALCDPPLRDDGDEWSLSPPHERALARALGLAGADGALPWAARQATADGVPPAGAPRGLVTPAHWHLGTDQVSLFDPAALALDDAGSRALFADVQELFTSEGFAVDYGAPLRWYLAHASLAGLPCASLDRVIGRNVDRWLGDGATLRLVRRLQSEVQMLLHTHPVNDRREALGLLPVNSFWLSGCGSEQPERSPPPQVDDRLRTPALADDWAAWARAWESLDDGPLAQALAQAQAGQGVRLTLCGERGAATFETAPRGLRRRLRAAWSRVPVLPVLESL